MTATAFDPVQYKTTTRRQWEEAAEAWHRWGPFLESWLGEATTVMLDGAGVVPGASVLDVAAGAGGQSLAAARRVGAHGRVVATDISPTILTYAAQQAAEEGLTVLETAEVDGEVLDGHTDGRYDAVISRLGLIYLPDQAAALARAREALRPGGAAAFVVYTTPDRNGFFSGPVGVIRGRAGLPAPAPGLPGPFSLGAPGQLAGLMEAAGFREVRADVVDAPVLLPSAEECLRFERESFGALHQMLAGVPEAEREDVWDEVGRLLQGYEGAEGFAGPCELLVVRGVR